MTEMDDRIKQFVNYLLSLTREGREDRGALADLRSGLAVDPGQAPRMFRHVVPHLGEREQRGDRWFYVVGAMFGANPRHVQGNTIGKCFKAYADKEGKGKEDADEPSNGVKRKKGEARFIALLGSHPDDLHAHLYHATGLLKSKEIGLDYYKLLDDLIDWDRADRRVQNKWARHYYRNDNNEKGEDNNE